MQVFSTKLSRHVLGMKFMRKTKEQVDKDKSEQKFRKHFATNRSADGTKIPSSSSSVTGNDFTPASASIIIEEIGSYSQCEGHIFGRQSFGGFNPVLESNVKKGIWRPFYLDPATFPAEEGKVEAEDGELSGSDEDEDEKMAKTYGSLVGTLAKRFMRKKDRNNPESNSIKMKVDPDSEEMDRQKQGGRERDNKRKQWNKGRRGNNESSGSGQGQQGLINRNNKRKNTLNQSFVQDSNNAPANKRTKFMKPSDD